MARKSTLSPFMQQLPILPVNKTKARIEVLNTVEMNEKHHSEHDLLTVKWTSWTGPFFTIDSRVVEQGKSDFYLSCNVHFHVYRTEPMRGHTTSADCMPYRYHCFHSMIKKPLIKC